MRVLGFFLALALCLAVVSAATNYQFNIAIASCSVTSGDPLSGTGCPNSNDGPLKSYLITDATGNQGIAPSGTNGASIFPVPIYLSVGDTLNFTLTTATTSGGHPFTICSGSDLTQTCAGATGANLLTPLITAAGSTAVYTFNTAGTYYYGCNNHPGMGSQIIVVATGALNTQESICTYYTRAITGGNSANAAQQLNFITLVVNRAVFGSSGTTPVVQGILGTGSPIAKFFTANNGTTAYCNGGSTARMCSFPYPSGAFDALAMHLYAFFGDALGCNAIGFPVFTREVGCNAGSNANGCSMTQVHQFMNINQAQFDYFNLQVVNSVKSYTNNGNDLRPGDAPALQGFLNGFGRGADNRATGNVKTVTASGASQQICSAADCTLSQYAQGAGFAVQPSFVVLALVAALAMLF